MSAPDDHQQIEIADVAAEMNADPLSKALFELAQYKVILRKQIAANELLKDRIAELEKQKPEGPKK